MKSKILGLLAVGLLAGPMAANAASLYSNLGAGDTFDNVYGWPTFSLGAAMQFVAAGSGNASSVDAGATDFSGGNLQFSLYTDSGSNTLGSLLGSTSTVTPSGNVVLVNSVFGSPISLAAGQKYWLLAVGGAGWFFNSTGATGIFRDWDGSYRSGETLSAFRINSSVPEPGTLALLGLGLAGLGLSRRRKAN